MITFLYTLITPTINKIDMNIVMQRLTAKIILTTDDGNQSNAMVRNSTRTVNSAINVPIASKMPNIPDTIEPVASELNLQHVFRIGPAIFAVYYLQMK